MSYLDALLETTYPILLTRDLDLVVVPPSGKTYLGGNGMKGDTQNFSTNEKVIVSIDELEISEYKIQVYTGSFIDAGIGDQNQKFSVVATGNIENGFLEFNDAGNCSYFEWDPENPIHCKRDANSGMDHIVFQFDQEYHLEYFQSFATKNVATKFFFFFFCIDEKGLLYQYY